MNASYLGDEPVKSDIDKIWNSHPNLGFTRKLRRVIKFYKDYSLWKAKEQRQEETELRRLVQEAVERLQGDLLDKGLQAHLGTLSMQLQVLEEKLAEGQRIRSKVKWEQFGDSSSKEFFKSTWEYSGASNITELEDEAGTVFTSLEQICHWYYSSLYSACPTSPERDKLWKIWRLGASWIGSEQP
jgi:hypothetical protein